MFKLSTLRVKRKIVNDPFYRFQSLSEIAIAIELGIKIDVNQATVDDWLRLPGFSIRQAQILVELVARGIKLLCIEDIAAAINVPVVQLQPWEPILLFAYYDTLSPFNPAKISINQASVAELASVPLLNGGLAEEIIAQRQQQGKFKNVLDLQSRLQLDNQLLEQIIYYLKF